MQTETNQGGTSAEAITPRPLSSTVSGAIAATYHDKFALSMPECRIMMILAEYPGYGPRDGALGEASALTEALTAEFREGTISGFSGCNTFSAYSISGVSDEGGTRSR